MLPLDTKSFDKIEPKRVTTHILLKKLPERPIPTMFIKTGLL